MAASRTRLPGAGHDLIDQPAYLPIEVLLVLATVAVLTPLVLGLCAFVPATRRQAGVLLPWAATPALVLAVVSYGPAWGGLVPWLLLGSGVGLDLAGRVCLLCLGLTWTLSALSARPWHLHDAAGSRLAGFFLLAMAGHIGLTLSQDAVTFCVCFAIMSGAAYGLVVHNGSPDAKRAGRHYIYMVVAAGVLLGIGLVVAVDNAGSFDLAMLSRGMLGARSGLIATTAFLLAFGVLAGLVPMHGWLPSGLAVVPGAAAAALSAAFSLTAALGWLRFVPLGPVALPDWGFSCLAVGLISVGYGVMQGLRQRNPAALLGWSTVSQMGVVATAIGMAFVAPGAAAALKVAVVVYAAHHALAKTALFLGADAAGAASEASPHTAERARERSASGAAPPPRHSRSPSVIPANAGIQNWTPAPHQVRGKLIAGVTKDLLHLERDSQRTMSGPAHRSRTLWVAILAVPVLVLAGAPLTSGAMSAAVLAHALGLSGMRSAGTLITLVSLALAAHTVLMCRFLHLLVQQQPAPARAAIPWAWTWVVVATAVSLLSPWLVLRLAADPAEAITLSTLWPVVAGVAAGAAAVATSEWKTPLSSPP